MSGDTVRTYISDDYYEHEHFATVPQTWWSESDVYDVPRAQVDRWRAAKDAWEAAQGEMRALMTERSRRRTATPGPDENACGQAERWKAEEAARAEAEYWGEASREMIANMTERRERQTAERLAEIRRVYGGAEER